MTVAAGLEVTAVELPDEVPEEDPPPLHEIKAAVAIAKKTVIALAKRYLFILDLANT